jgi:aquaporin Z
MAEPAELPEAKSPEVSGPYTRYLAEGVGTFVLVLGGVGTAVLAGSRVGALGVALAFGLSLLAMVYAIGPISGCHVNPAVTVGLWLAGRFERRHVSGYVAAQILGGILASFVILLIARGAVGGYAPSVAGLGANGYGLHSPGGFGGSAAFLSEVVLTGLLVFTVLSATSVRAPVGFAGIPIGLVLTLIHLVSIPVTNTSVNPARSIGPALFVGGWALGQLWLFIIAPLIGSVGAAALYRTLQGTRRKIAAREALGSLKSQVAERLHEATRPRS